VSDALSTITNEHATTKMTNIEIRIIQNLVEPLMDIASDVSLMSANVVGPIAGGNYAHRREEVKRKKMIKSTKVTQKTSLVMVNKFVHGHSPPDKRVQLKRKVVLKAAAALWRQRGGSGGRSAAVAAALARQR
jgi:hypothetical protein